MINQGSLWAEKIAYPEYKEVWCCVWRNFTGEEEDGIRLCFDFRAEDLDDMIALLQELRDLEPEIVDEDD